MVRGTVLSIIAVFLLAAGTASASYTIGAPSSPATLGAVGSLPAGATHYFDVSPALNAPAPSAGVVVQFEARWTLTTAGIYAFRVLRPVLGGKLRGAGSAPIPQPANSAVTSVGARLPIAAGDTIGLDHPDGSFIAFGDQPGQVYNLLTPPPADGASATPGPMTNNKALLLNAVVEPDADGDRYGDETQDACPSDPSIHGPCPSLAPLPITQLLTAGGVAATPRLAPGTFTADSKGVARLPVSCPAGASVPCAGSIGLEVRGATLARASRATTFSIPAGTSSTVSVALSRRGLALLIKKKRLSARAVVTSGGTSLTAAVTLKAPRVSKKKKP